MNILWITNIVLPEALTLLNSGNALKGTGGWMVGAANTLVQTKNINLSIATPSNRVTNLKILKGQQITYYLFPLGSGNHKYNPSFEPYYQKIRD